MRSRYLVVLLTLCVLRTSSGNETTPAGEETPVKCGFQQAVVRTGMQQEGGIQVQRQDRQKNVVVGHFRVHYDTTGEHAAAFLDGFSRPIPGTADAFADSAASIANAVHTLEVTSLGYLPPPPDGNAGGGSEYDIYILNLGAVYGSTYPETALDPGPEGARYSGYMEIDNDFVFVNPPGNRGLPALRVTLAHEFQHAIQLGGYGFWQDHIYFYEMTATWMEDFAYTDVDDYIQYLFSSESQFSHPETGFATSTLIMYSRAVWGHFIAKRFGENALRTAWEISFQYHVSPLAGMDLALQTSAYGSDLRSAFSEWTLWNFFTGSRYDDEYYPEGVSYPLIAEVTSNFPGMADTLVGSLPPLAARYHQVLSSGTPLHLVAVNLDVNEAEAGGGTPRDYSYYLSTGQPDPLFQETLAGIFVKQSVEDPFEWETWAIVNGLASTLDTELPPVATGVTFPNPFRPEVHGVLNIPLEPNLPVEIELSVFSSDMALIYSTRTVSVVEKGQRVVRWDGMTSRGDVAQSGIYFFAATGNGVVTKGKFALVRR